MLSKDIAGLLITLLFILAMIWLFAIGPFKTITDTIGSLLGGVAGWFSGSNNGGKVGGVFGGGVSVVPGPFL